MHVAALNPQWVTRDVIPQDVVDEERSTFAASDEVQSKPEQARDKIVDGMLNKRFFQANVLVDQEWVHDSSKTVAQALQEAGAEVVDFARLSVT
jgi:elongation factor Ts